MRLAVVALLALVGCGNSVGDDAPIYGGGGGGGGGTSGGDGGLHPDTNTGDAGPQVSGKVCIVTDARLLTTSCKTTMADDLLVTLASNMARTAADGSFMITDASDPQTFWNVTSDATSGTEILPSLQQVGLSTTISAVSTMAYQKLLFDNGADQPDGSGGIFIRVTHNGLALGQVTAVTAQTQQGIYYDNDLSASQWKTDATETNGIVWIPGATPALGTVSVTLTPPAPAAPITTNINVSPGSLTFTIVAVP